MQVAGILRVLLWELQDPPEFVLVQVSSSIHALRVVARAQSGCRLGAVRMAEPALDPDACARATGRPLPRIAPHHRLAQSGLLDLGHATWERSPAGQGSEEVSVVGRCPVRSRHADPPSARCAPDSNGRSAEQLTRIFS
jgi:hypothetical protein